MNPIELKKGVYWVGAIDWSLRSFHGYTTSKGSTYNAYLIVDEKIVLIDTVKAQFAEELLERVSKIVDPAKIDYIISNHVEMDHSGAIPRVMEVAKQAKIVTSAPQGVKGLTAHFGQYDYMTVKAGDTLDIGKRTLSFVPTPMLHWPDNMVTYCPEDKILFSNDAFGQHYASSGRFDDEEQLEDILVQARLYYANILMPFTVQAQKACEIVAGLEMDLIAPSHGIIWRSHINKILECYNYWSANETENEAVIVFDSMWHSTEKMATVILEAFTDKGVKAKFFDLKYCHNSDIVSEVLTARYIAVGSPTLNNNMLPSVASFLTYLKGLAPKGNRKAFAFGSYGWGGQSIEQVEKILEECGFEIVIPKIRLQYIPSETQLKELTESVYTII